MRTRSWRLKARAGTVGKVNSLYIARESSSVFSGDYIYNNQVSQDIDFAVSLLGVPLTYAAQSVSRTVDIDPIMDSAGLTFECREAALTASGSLKTDAR
jgi:hypothetical protein